MTLHEFLTRLATEGVAVVTADDELEPDGAWHDVVRAWDVIQRRELASSAPALSLTAAEWAAVRLYRACQALLCREVSPRDVQRFLGAPCPEPPSASAAYSVDLLFRFLPDLVKLAQRVARADPLVEELLKLARAWPLSSVGIAEVGAVDSAPLLAHPALRQHYIDRIITAGDTARLQDPAVRQAVQSSLGLFPELAPSLSAALA